VARDHWEDCHQADPPCYANAAAIIIDDQDYACKGIKEKNGTGNCFRPSYKLTDLT